MAKRRRATRSNAQASTEAPPGSPAPEGPWMPRKELERALNRWAAANDSEPLHVTGAEGAGKTALVKHWLARHQARHPEDFVHYAAADLAAGGRRPEDLLRGLLVRLRTAYGFREPVPAQAEALIEMLPHWLARAGALGRAVIVLDGLDRLEDTDLTGEFQWLPGHLPPGVRLALVHGLQRGASEAFGDESSRLTVPELSTEESATLIRQLPEAPPSWPSEWTDALLARDLGGNPLYLSSAVGFAGRQEALPAAESLRELGQALLEEAEALAGGRDALAPLATTLWAARSGLPRGAAMEIAETTDEAPWTALRPLLACLDEDRWVFAHPVFREAVTQRYLREGLQQQQAHLRLARPLLRAKEPGATREAAWQLARAGYRESLVGVLLNPEHAAALTEAEHRPDFIGLWREVLGDESPIPRYQETLRDEPLAADERCRHLVEAVEAARAGGWVEGLPLALREVLDQAEDPVLRERAAYLLGSLLAESDDVRGHGPSFGAQEAEQRLRQALESRSERLGADHPETAAPRHALASLLEERGELDEAEALYREALEHREARHGTASAEILPELTNLGALLKAGNRISEAKPLYRRAAEIAQRELGQRHPGTATALDHYAGIFYAEHDFEAARDLYQQALGVAEQAFGPRHSATAACLHNLATALDACEDYASAERLYRQALAVRRELHGNEHSDTASSLHNLAAVLDVTGQRDEAETLYREAIATWQELVGPEHPATATSVNNLADLLREAGQLGEAEQLYRHNLETWKALVGDEHPHTLMTLTELGGLLTDAGRYHESEPLLRDAADRTARILGRSHSHHLTAVCKLAVVHRDRGDRAGARQLLEQTLAHVEGTLGLFSPQVQRVRRLLENLQNPDTLH